MITHLNADINCSTCFNPVIDGSSSMTSIEQVDPHIVDDCIAVTHNLDEADRLAIVTTIGHTLDIAPTARS